MAAFNIDTISKNSLVLSGSNSGYNNFYINELEKLKQNEDGSVTISYSGFSEVFLSNKNNYYIYKITKTLDADDYYTITLHYNYIENKNGVHLFAPSENTFRVKKSILDDSGFNNIINFQKETLSAIEHTSLNKMNEQRELINDLEKRIRPNVEKILDDFFDIGLSIDFSKYQINKQEFIDYVRNNPLYIRKYIMECSYNISTALKTSISCAIIFSLEIIVTLITNDVTLFSYISYVLFTLSITGGFISLGLIEKGLSEIKKCEPNTESLFLRRRKRE